MQPSTVTIKAGESVTWVNNAGFPHNIVFDEDEVPVSNDGLALPAACLRLGLPRRPRVPRPNPAARCAPPSGPPPSPTLNR